MNQEKRLPSSQPEFERGFAWTLLISGFAHAIILGSIILVPGFMLRPQPPLKSYTVDLVDPSLLGGTNLVAGSRGKAAAPPKVEPAKAKAEEPPPPPEKAKVEPAAAPEEKPAPPKEPEAKPPEPPKPEAKAEEAIALEKQAAPTPTRLQEMAAKVEPTPTRPQEVAKVPPTIAPAPPTQPKPTAAKPLTTPTAKTAGKPAATPAKATPQAVAKAAAPPAPKGAPTAAKAAVSAGPVKGTPAANPKATAEARARDDRIAAAVDRIKQKEQTGTRGAGGGAQDGGGAPGGPISIGPGEGTGGEVRSLAFIMYTTRLEAMIKEKWAWAGARALKADIAFNILPGGGVANVRTVVSSGDVTYDKLAETAVRAASPFPPPPEEYQSEFEDVGFVYTFEPE